MTNNSDLEAEKCYYESIGPLADGKRGRIHKPDDRKHSSFLCVRLTGTELTKLRDIAAKRGIGPSTLARALVLAEIDRCENIDNGLPGTSIGH